MAVRTRDIHWVAGLLEGEGSFERKPTTIAIRCGMTDRDTVERLAQIVGTGAVYAHSVTKGDKQVWSWGIYSKNAAQWMMTLWPLMGERRKQRIAECLTWWATLPRPGYVNRAKTHCSHGHPFDEGNTYRHGSKRHCRTCRRDAQARLYAKRKGLKP